MTTNEKAKEMRREYLNNWRAKNKDKVREANKRYWQRKTAKTAMRENRHLLCSWGRLLEERRKQREDHPEAQRSQAPDPGKSRPSPRPAAIPLGEHRAVC